MTLNSQSSSLLLSELIRNKTATVGVIGLGYVGLPLVRAFIKAGFKTIGFDTDQKKIDLLNSGTSYISHISSAWIKPYIDNGSFSPTSDMNRLSEADALLICVPTPLSESRDPDLYYVESTSEAIAKRLRCNQLIVLESTTYPGTTRNIMLPILERSGLKAGEDFYLAFSPEREDPGNPDFTAEGIPKLVGGLDDISGELAVNLYSHAIVKVIKVSSCEVAEAAKIVENTYRCVNIAMVNELKIIFDRLGIDVWEVIEAAKTKPFGFQAFYPGPGLGGHCIPIDPFYLSWCARKAGLTTRFIELAGEINTAMPLYVIRRVIDALNDKRKALNGSNICVLGLAYKKDVDDPRESPSFELIDRLINKGAIVTYNDPYIPVLPSMRHWKNIKEMKSMVLSKEFLSSQDCVLIATDHSVYDYEFIVKNSELIVDCRNATKNIKIEQEKIVKA
ncbi:MAG: nucleotide sugar dehydrogenase [Planctomycetaceae bacterium]|jgi:UDP-N-acetyl-D-glucosamine dehydrogenase|nr:nucleotide sugar dehydrogenase [Planctomycetaceae bacterium]